MAKVPTQRKTDYVISYAFSLSIRNRFSLAILVQQKVVHPGNQSFQQTRFQHCPNKTGLSKTEGEGCSRDPEILGSRHPESQH